MPSMIFKARCDACGEDRKFIEFKVVPCGPHADAAKREYGFRCLTCKARVEEIADLEGEVHRWEKGQHVAAPRAPPQGSR